jgi:hypothetical protein
MLNRFQYTESEEKAITQRPSQSAYIFLDSIDRYVLASNGAYNAAIETNPNNIYINHQKTLGLGQIKRLTINEIYFPWRTPNVNERNNEFVLSLNLNQDLSSYTDCMLNVPEGFYTPSELAHEMQTIMNSNNGWKTVGTNIDVSNGRPWSVSVDPITSNFILISTRVNFQTIQQTSLYYNISSLKSNLNFLINFYPPKTGLVKYVAPNYIFSGGIPSMYYTRYIDICSDTLCKHQRLKDNLTQFNYTNIIYRLYLNYGGTFNQPLTDSTYFASRPCDIYRQIIIPKYILWNKDEMINQIDIKLYDDAGELLYIPTDAWDANYLISFLISED